MRPALAISVLGFLPVDSLPPKFDFCFEWERLMIAGLLRLVLGRLFLLKLRTSELDPMDTSCVLPLLLWPALSMFMYMEEDCELLLTDLSRRCDEPNDYLEELLLQYQPVVDVSARTFCFAYEETVFCRYRGILLSPTLSLRLRELEEVTE